jgi:hypothetical protein
VLLSSIEQFLREERGLPPLVDESGVGDVREVGG